MIFSKNRRWVEMNDGRLLELFCHACRKDLTLSTFVVCTICLAYPQPPFIRCHDCEIKHDQEHKDEVVHHR